jgi:hypothetical protein
MNFSRSGGEKTENKKDPVAAESRVCYPSPTLRSCPFVSCNTREQFIRFGDITDGKGKKFMFKTAIQGKPVNAAPNGGRP